MHDPSEEYIVKPLYIRLTRYKTGADTGAGKNGVTADNRLAEFHWRVFNHETGEWEDQFTSATYNPSSPGFDLGEFLSEVVQRSLCRLSLRHVVDRDGVSYEEKRIRHRYEVAG